MRRLFIVGELGIGLIVVLLLSLSIREPIKDSNDKVTGYVKNEWGVYFDGRLIPGADPATFRFLGYVPVPASTGDEYAADATHVYWFDQILPGADPASFKLYPQVWQCAEYYACEARDAKNYYFENMVVNING